MGHIKVSLLPLMTLSQGSFLLSVGAELDFVSSSSAKNHQGITIKLLKVDLDYTINERYRFFVPKIEETAMRCYQNEEVICGIGDRRSRSSSSDDSSERVLTLNKVLTIVEIGFKFRFGFWGFNSFVQ